MFFSRYFCQRVNEMIKQVNDSASGYLANITKVCNKVVYQARRIIVCLAYLRIHNSHLIMINPRRAKISHAAERYATNNTFTGSAGECCALPLYYGGECEKRLTASTNLSGLRFGGTSNGRRQTQRRCFLFSGKTPLRSPRLKCL